MSNITGAKVQCACVEFQRADANKAIALTTLICIKALISMQIRLEYLF